MKLKLLSMTFGYPQFRFLSISQASDLLTPNLPHHSLPQVSLPSQLVFQFLPEMQPLCLSDEFLLKQDYTSTLKSAHVFRQPSTEFEFCHQVVLPLSSSYTTLSQTSYL